MLAQKYHSRNFPDAHPIKQRRLEHLERLVHKELYFKAEKINTLKYKYSICK